jgi:protein-S-isoprenylcysteine O-methyltransferase Ste14
MNNSAHSHGRGPGVIVPPPLWFVAGFVMGWLFDRKLLHHDSADGPTLGAATFAVGGFLMMAGLSLVCWGILTFTRAKTAVYPNRDASRLVDEGPYRFTRNPMYTGMTMAYIGACVLFSVLWALVVLPLVLLAVYRFVIAREEAYLTEAFGDAYRDYQRRVGRWG